MNTKNTTLHTFMHFGIIAAIMLVVYKIYTNAKTVTGSIINDTSDAIIGNALGNAGTRDVRMPTVRIVTKNCHDALNSGYFGWTEDEELLINALNQLVSANEARAVSQLYQNDYGKSLKSEIQRLISDSDTRKIKTLIFTNLF